LARKAQQFRIKSTMDPVMREEAGNFPSNVSAKVRNACKYGGYLFS